MPVSYRKTPLTEAIFEFIPGEASLSVEGREDIDRAFAEEFSGPKEDLVGGMAFEFSIAQGELRKTGTQPTRFRRWNQDKTRLFQIADDMCAFNVLRPYTHYVEYLPFMERLVRLFTEKARPKSIKLLGQRYLNRVLLPPGASPADFFTVYPGSDQVRSLGNPGFALQMQTEAMAGGAGQVVLALAYQGIDASGQLAYMLDLYARSIDNPPVPFAWEVGKAWQDVAHDAVKRAFEFAITDRCRELLEREES